MKTREEEMIKSFTELVKAAPNIMSLLCEAAKFGLAWSDSHQKNPWRDAKKDPPKDDRDVFIKWGKNDPAQRLHGVGSYHKSLFQENNGWSINDVTHWMPIPELPKGE